MERQGQIDLLKRLLHYVDARTTSLADAPWCNDVSVYTDPQHLAREQQQLFRGHALLMGFASQWPGPGAYRTDDYAGVPILVVRGRDRRLRAFLKFAGIAAPRWPKTAVRPAPSPALIMPGAMT